VLRLQSRQFVRRSTRLHNGHKSGSECSAESPKSTSCAWSFDRYETVAGSYPFHTQDNPAAMRFARPISSWCHHSPSCHKRPFQKMERDNHDCAALGIFAQGELEVPANARECDSVDVCYMASENDGVCEVSDFQPCDNLRDCEQCIALGRKKVANSACHEESPLDDKTLDCSSGHRGFDPTTRVYIGHSPTSSDTCLGGWVPVASF
jgi:hypothetical protein